MSLRVLLILIIGIGLASIAVTRFVLRPHLRQIVTERNKNLQDYQVEQRLHSQTKGKLKDSQAKLQQTEANLSGARTQLAAAQTRAAEQEQRAATLARDLTRTKQELAGAKADLAAWQAPGIPVEQLKAIMAELKKLRSQNEARQEEVALLAAIAKKNRPTDDGDPALPAGLKGKVLTVDPKFDFVVLDIGAEKGAQPRGVLLVAREGELVGKVRVASVQSERSIANIIPGWKLREIKEGDQVLY